VLRKISYRIWLIVLSGLIWTGSALAQTDTLYDADGNVSETGTMVDGYKDGLWMAYYPGGQVKAKGSFDRGYKTGQWIWYHENGEISSVEKWNRGIYKQGQYWDDKGNPSDISEVFTDPQYPGGIEAFTRMITENIQYPEDVMSQGLEGRVVLKFRIDSNGRLVNPKPISTGHPELEKEAMRVVMLSDRWVPATFHGKRTSSMYTFPITFALQ
jgi:TonB family protein